MDFLGNRVEPGMLLFSGTHAPLPPHQGLSSDGADRVIHVKAERSFGKPPLKAWFSTISVDNFMESRVQPHSPRGM
jgi:hypothetical protein